MKESSFITNNGPSKSYIIIHLSPPNSSKQQRRQTKEPRWFGILQTISFYFCCLLMQYVNVKNSCLQEEGF
jgi:hypothetical protein